MDPGRSRWVVEVYRLWPGGAEPSGYAFRAFVWSIVGVFLLIQRQLVIH